MVNQKNLNQAMSKAAVLVEALPYIQKFNRKIMVIKYGGSAMEDPVMRQKVMEDAVLLKLVGFKPILVHGGGKEITRWSEKLGLASNFVNGVRITDRPTLEIAEMALSRVNQDLVAMINRLGVKAVGISGKDGCLLQAEKKQPAGRDIGFVGQIKKVNGKLLLDLLEKDFLPVVFPIGMDQDGQAYNINADDAACEIAKTMGAEKLAFLTDTDGVLAEKQNSDSLISELPLDTARGLIHAGKISGGMLPKLYNCIDAIENGVSRVHILNGCIPHCLLLEIFTHKGVGTAIIGNKTERFYHE